MSNVLVMSQTGKRISLERLVDGKPLKGADLRADPDKWSDREFRLAAEELGVAKMDLKAWVRGFLAGGPDTVSLIPESPPAAFRVRGMSGPVVASFDTFSAALAASPLPPEPVIEWDTTDACCALDVDFHGCSGPSSRVHDLVSLVTTLNPVPDYWWITRHDGLRAAYCARDIYTGEDLAAVAALAVAREFPEAAIELNHRTRFPDPGKPRGSFETQTADTGALRRLSGRLAAGDREWVEWLEARGFEPGGRYPHTACPVHPGPRAEANANPVCVRDEGIFCYVCAADGVTHGSREPGWFPAGRLVGSYDSTLFGDMVRRFTHWEHARLVVERLFPGRVAKAVYRAALKREHGDDPRIARVFTAGQNLIRYEGFWGDEHGVPVLWHSTLPATLAALPAALVPDGESGRLAVSPQSVEWLRHPGDIAGYGYPAVVPVFGVRISQADPEESRIYTVIHTPELRAASVAHKRPKYLPASDRPANPWEPLEQAYPGLRRDVIQLLLAAKGCAEAAAGLPPMMFFSGPTKSGKTASVQIAAAIAGDHARIVPFTPNTERLRAGLYDAKANGTYAFFDEFLKGVAKSRDLDPAAALETLLNFTPTSVSHILYVGPVPLGRLPVCIWADTSVPRCILEHAQLARRLCWVRLHSQVSWETSANTLGIRNPERLRAEGSPELCRCADAILSEVMDRWFRGGNPIFRDIARDLGFQFMEEVDVSSERLDSIREFFTLLRGLSIIPENQRGRYKDPTWRLIDLNKDGGATVKAWLALADPRSRTDSRVIDETDLQQVLGLRCPARLDRRCDGAALRLRLVSAGPVDGRIIYNEELYALELEPDGPGLHGPGDTERVEPEGCGFPEIPGASFDAIT